MTRGYDQPLYILPFDHRHSYIHRGVPLARAAHVRTSSRHFSEQAGDL
jgi:hypothetical protein